MAIQKEIYGFEIGDIREFQRATISSNFGGAAVSGVFVDNTKSRSGNAYLRLNPSGGQAVFARLAGGTIIGQSPTIANGAHTRVRVRLFVLFDAFPGSQARIFGQGTFSGNAVLWSRADGRFGVSSNTQNTITWSADAMVSGQWYQVVFDIDYAGGASATAVTVTATVTDDATHGLVYNNNVSVGSSLGTTAPTIDVLCFGDNGADTARASNVRWDDVTAFAVTGSDAAVAPTLPTGTHIQALLLTGVALQQWETGLYTDCDEQPLDQSGGLGDTMSSILGAGTTVSFTKSNMLGYAHALKVFQGMQVVALGNGALDVVVMGATYSLVVNSSYSGATNNPVVCTDWTGYYAGAVDASVFSVIKRNSTTQSYIGSILAEALWVDPATSGVTGGTGASPILPPTQIRGSTQIKPGTIFDAQIADGAQIDARKIRNLAFPVFFQEEGSDEDAMLAFGGSSSSSGSAAVSSIGASAYRGTNQTLTHATEAAISLSAVNFDTSVFWSGGSPTRLTVPSAGKYHINAQAQLGTGFTGVGHLRIYVNGSQVAGNSFVGADVASGSERHTVTWIGSLAANDFVELKIQLDLAAGSGNFDVVGGSASTFVEVVGAVSGSAPSGALVQLAQVVTSGSQATIDFSSIPVGYTSLILRGFVRDTQAGSVGQQLRVQINADGTSGNYSSAGRIGSQNGAAFASQIAASSSGGGLGSTVQDSHTAGIWANVEWYFENYGSTSAHKRVDGRFSYDDGLTSVTVYSGTFRWAAVAAINQITIKTEGTAFKDGSTLTLYGVK